MAGEVQTAEERKTEPTGPADAAVSRDPGTPDTAPDDADDLRGFHFRRLIHRRSTWLWGGIPTVIVAIALAFGNVVWVPIILILGTLITLIVCWIKAVSRAEDAFFIAYAEECGMTRTEDGQLPGSTPLLRKGDERKAEEILSGPLGDGADGSVALYTYTDVYHDKDGRHETDYHFTVATTDLPVAPTACRTLPTGTPSKTALPSVQLVVFTTSQTLFVAPVHVSDLAEPPTWSLMVVESVNRLKVKRVLSGAFKVGGTVAIAARRLTSVEATYDLVKTMRASVLVLGPLVGRCKRAVVALPMRPTLPVNLTPG